MEAKFADDLWAKFIFDYVVGQKTKATYLNLT